VFYGDECPSDGRISREDQTFFDLAELLTGPVGGAIVRWWSPCGARLLIPRDSMSTTPIEPDAPPLWRVALVATVLGVLAFILTSLAVDLAGLVPEVEATPRLPGDAALSAEGVVEEQLRALAACRVDRKAVARVFALASPANRAVTGPLPVFERMLWSETFLPLVQSRAWTVGRARVVGDVAVVLVTTTDAEGRTAAFRFLLQRADADRGGGWETSGVFPLLEPEPTTPLADRDPKRRALRPA
jgi:hypothetical protein